MPSCASSSVDLMLAVCCGLTLQICLIIALSFRCRPWRLGFVNGQVSLARSIALYTQELYTLPCVLKERWREERTGISSLNLFQPVFTCVVAESSQPPAAKSMVAKGSYELQLVRPDLNFPLWSVITFNYTNTLDCTVQTRFTQFSLLLLQLTPFSTWFTGTHLKSSLEVKM